MSILVDTPIWSLALRRQSGVLSSEERALVLEWRRLVAAGGALLPAPVRYELLSGTRDDRAFEEVRLRLRPMVTVPIETEDFEYAARCRNECDSRGIAGPPIDMFLCAMALRRGSALFTVDGDFARYARVLPIRLHSPR